MNENIRKIKQMESWTIAVFATIFAVTLSTLWMLNYPVIGQSRMDTLAVIFSQAWVIILVDLVLCWGVFVGYKAYMEKRD